MSLALERASHIEEEQALVDGVPLAVFGWIRQKRKPFPQSSRTVMGEW
jgi:hypothetical protein